MNHVVYPDGKVVLAPPAKALQELLNTCHEFAQRHDITFSSTKTVCLFFITRNRTLYLDQFKMGTVLLSVTEEVKYLGHLIRLSFKDNNDILRKLNIIGNVLIRRFGGCSREVKRELFRTHC